MNSSKDWVSICCDANPRGAVDITKAGTFGQCSKCGDGTAEFELNEDEVFPKREPEPENQDL